MRILTRKQLQEFHSEAFQAGVKDATIDLVYAFHKFFNEDKIPKSLNVDECVTDTITFRKGKKIAKISWHMINYGKSNEIALKLKAYDNNNV